MIRGCGDLSTRLHGGRFRWVATEHSLSQAGFSSSKKIKIRIKVKGIEKGEKKKGKKQNGVRFVGFPRCLTDIMSFAELRCVTRFPGGKEIKIIKSE